MHQRIVVLGTSGSGKTTLARAIAARLNVPHLELDAVHWKPNWTPALDEQMWPIIERHVIQPAWTLDGNYSRFRDLTLGRADTIIWLDYSLTVSLTRVVRRTIRRCWTGEELWNGNRESWWSQLATRDSIVVWCITTWRKRRREHPALLAEQRRRGKRIYRFRTPAETEQWLKKLPTRSEEC